MCTLGVNDSGIIKYMYFIYIILTINIRVNMDAQLTKQDKIKYVTLISFEKEIGVRCFS